MYMDFICEKRRRLQRIVEIINDVNNYYIWNAHK